MNEHSGQQANFVEIVGYSLEKVHMGMLAWLLDTTSTGCGDLATKDKCDLVRRLFGLDLDPSGVQVIRTCKEDSPGSRIRSDLRIVIEAKGGVHWVIVEAKTESDVDPKQLERMEDAYRIFGSRQEQQPTLCFSLLMFGASQFTVKNTEPPVKDTWVQRDLRGIAESIASLPTKHSYVETWLESLQKRCDDLTLVASRWQMGRMSRPDYYAILDLIRTQLVGLQGNNDSKWRIINGQFNAAMYCRTFPKSPAARRRLGTSFWWDIDDDFLVLKGQANQDQVDSWNAVKETARNAIAANAELIVRGERTRNRSGADQSLWKWRVIGDNPNPAGIARAAYDIILKVEACLAAECGFHASDV